MEINQKLTRAQPCGAWRGEEKQPVSLGSVETHRRVGEWEAVRMESGECSLHGLMGDCGNRSTVSVVRVRANTRIINTQSTCADTS